jgi:type IV pilus assembly protein PilA
VSTASPPPDRAVLAPGAIPRARARGFSLMEIMVAVAIVAVIATLAVPSLMRPVVRDQIVAAAPLIDVAKKQVAAVWTGTQQMPANNAAAGLPAPDKMVNNYVQSVTVTDGVIDVTFGNSAHGEIAGRVLTFRPAIVEDAPIVPLAWVCGFAAVPDKMTVRGENRTSVPRIVLPFNCQPPG